MHDKWPTLGEANTIPYNEELNPVHSPIKSSLIPRRLFCHCCALKARLPHRTWWN